MKPHEQLQDARNHEVNAPADEYRMSYIMHGAAEMDAYPETRQALNGIDETISKIHQSAAQLAESLAKLTART